MTGEELKKELAAKYPEVGLTFGYIGNCGSGYDDRSWYFFTKISIPGQKYGGMKWGRGVRTAQVDEMVARAASGELEQWIIDECLPNLKHRWRSFYVYVPDYRRSLIVEKELERVGCSFGSRGGGRMSFSVRYKTLEDIQAIVNTWAGDLECEVREEER